MIHKAIVTTDDRDPEPTIRSGSDRWAVPTAHPFLSEDEVHVWRAEVDLPAERLQRLETLLSEEERERADRFLVAPPRRRFVVGRGLLRALLGAYLDADPARLRFTYGPHGKPALFDDSAISFNVSHSGDLVLGAFARRREVGVDVERFRPDFAGEEIAQRFFSPREVAALRALPAESRLDGFFACWARKEAYIKARGLGLSLPLDRFHVALDPQRPAALLGADDDPDAAARWSLCALAPGVGYAGALAVEGHRWRLRCWQWDGARWGDDERQQESRRSVDLPDPSRYDPRAPRDRATRSRASDE